MLVFVPPLVSKNISNTLVNNLRGSGCWKRCCVSAKGKIIPYAYIVKIWGRAKNTRSTALWLYSCFCQGSLSNSYDFIFDCEISNLRIAHVDKHRIFMATLTFYAWWFLVASWEYVRRTGTNILNGKFHPTIHPFWCTSDFERKCHRIANALTYAAVNWMTRVFHWHARVENGHTKNYEKRVRDFDHLSIWNGFLSTVRNNLPLAGLVTSPFARRSFLSFGARVKANESSCDFSTSVMIRMYQVDANTIA